MIDREKIIDFGDEYAKAAVLVDASGNPIHGGDPADAPQYTPVVTRYTGAGTHPAGARALAVANSGSVDCQCAGATIRPGESFSFSPPEGGVLADLAYDATGGELTISEVR